MSSELSEMTVTINLLAMNRTFQALNSSREKARENKLSLLGNYVLKAYEDNDYHFGVVWKSHNVGNDVHFHIIFSNGGFQAMESEEVLALLWPEEFVPEEAAALCSEHQLFYHGAYPTIVTNCSHCPRRNARWSPELKFALTTHSRTINQQDNNKRSSGF